MHRYMTAYRRVTQLCMFCMYVLEPNVKPISYLNIPREVLQESNLLRRGQKNVKDYRDYLTVDHLFKLTTVQDMKTYQNFRQL